MTRTAIAIGLMLVVGMPVAAQAVPREDQCRFEQLDRATSTHHEVVRTVRCAGLRYGSRADVHTALRIGRCESGLTAEKAPHSGDHHGTYQYLVSTFHSQQRQMRAVTRGMDLSHHVHNMRANVVTAVAWMIKRTTGPWSCA